MIWNPWRRARELRAQLDHANFERAMLERALRDGNDRYDRIREANAQLRETLTLYRSEAQQ